MLKVIGTQEYIWTQAAINTAVSKEVITSKIKHAKKLKTSPARLEQLL